MAEGLIVTDSTIPAARVDVDPEQACPIAPVVDIVFSRWTTPILWSLNEYGRHRFVEMERRITTITGNGSATVESDSKVHR